MIFPAAIGIAINLERRALRTRGSRLWPFLPATFLRGFMPYRFSLFSLASACVRGGGATMQAVAVESLEETELTMGW